MRRIPDYIPVAANVYRTTNYIVRQKLSVISNIEDDTAIISRDTFYRRTPERDAEYERMFKRRERINGRRLPTSGYIREYQE